MITKELTYSSILYRTPTQNKNEFKCLVLHVYILVQFEFRPTVHSRRGGSWYYTLDDTLIDDVASAPIVSIQPSMYTVGCTIYIYKKPGIFSSKLSTAVDIIISSLLPSAFCPAVLVWNVFVLCIDDKRFV